MIDIENANNATTKKIMEKLTCVATNKQIKNSKTSYKNSPADPKDHTPLKRIELLSTITQFNR